jgi:hypothetical protein
MPGEPTVVVLIAVAMGSCLLMQESIHRAERRGTLR